MDDDEITRWFRSPTGVRSKNPPFQDVEESILQGGAALWTIGSQDGGLYFYQGEFKSRLTLMYSESCGFYVFCGTDKDWEEGTYSVSLSSTTNSRDPVEIEVGGEEILVPRCLFITPDECCAVARDFWDNGELSAVVQWGLATSDEWEVNE